MKITKYEYLKNEADHAARVAQSLPEGEEKAMFVGPAASLLVRLGKMTYGEANTIVLDTEA